jgi:hypothetical protein
MRLAQRAIGLFEFPAPEQAHRVDRGPRGIAHFFMKILSASRSSWLVA